MPGYPHRVAMLSMHTSPLATPGVGDAGGLNVYVAELAKRLGDRGIKVDVFTRADSPGAPEIVEVHEHTRVIRVPAGPYAPVAKELLPGLVDTFAERLDPLLAGYDLIHSHYWLSGRAGLDLSKRHGIPLVHTMHTMARVKNANLARDDDAEPWIRELGEAEIVAGAETLIANTADEAAELVEHYHADPGRIVVVPPGVDLHTFHPCDQTLSRTLLEVPLDAQVVLFVGRIQPLKAPDVLIRAIAELTRDGNPAYERVRLIIIGSPSGPNSAWARGLPDLADQLGVADRVEFRPHSQRAELFRWYCVSDVVGVPSHTESFGLVALEAQACGRPVVATDVGGLRHAVVDEQTGLLVPGQNPARWAAELGRLLSDPGLRLELGATAAAHAATFSWDNSAASTLRAYHQTVCPQLARTG